MAGLEMVGTLNLKMCFFLVMYICVCVYVLVIAVLREARRGHQMLKR